MCEREIFMIWILAIMIVVLIVFTIKEVFFDGELFDCFTGVLLFLLLIVSYFFISESQKDVTYLASETSSSSTTFTVETFEQQIFYNRDEKNYKIKCTYSIKNENKKETIDSTNPDTEITVQVKEPTEVVVTEIEYFSIITFQTNTLYSYYFM